jgi:predicted CxxxxCH...CXXCH cytochrome family protein
VAPPTDTAGSSSSTAVGAHQAHLSGSAISTAIACTECHPVPNTTTHATGTVAFAWGPRATANGVPTAPPSGDSFASSIQPSPSFDAASATCSSTYCHGNYAGTFGFPFPDATGDAAPQTYDYAGGAGSPKWTDGPMSCGSCHAMPPNSAIWHSDSHGRDATYRTCQLCHPDASGQISAGPTVTGAVITDVSQHVNGAIDLAPQFQSKCFDCH